MHAFYVTYPLFLVYVECAPQYSHLKLIIIKSEKYGTLIWHILIWPGRWQEWQGTSNKAGYCSIKLFYSKGLLKFIFVPNLFAYTCWIYCYAFYLLYPMAINCYKVLWVWLTYRFLSILGANGFFTVEFPLGSDNFNVKGNLFPFKYYIIKSKNFYSF